jgi:hypothetical protein
LHYPLCRAIISRYVIFYNTKTRRGGEDVSKKQKQNNIIKPDFSELIARQGLGRSEQEQSRTVTVTSADIEPAEQTDTGRAERLQRARELVQQEKQEREKEQDSGSEGEGEGEVLTGIDYRRGGPQTQPDVERQLLVLADGVRHGLSVPEIVKKHGIGRSTVQTYLAQMREEIELNSQIVDMDLAKALEGKVYQIIKAVDKSKLEKAGIRDLAIAAGIFLDKRKELLGPRSGTGNLRLRATFRGEGAIEVTTGEQ